MSVYTDLLSSARLHLEMARFWRRRGDRRQAAAQLEAAGLCRWQARALDP